jgi:oxygen-independent coproporphyrinogen-3 oxidase
MVLQLKTGTLDLHYFQQKFGVDIWQEFQPVYQQLQQEEMLDNENGKIQLSRRGILQVDHFLSEFFETELKPVRYA